METLLTIAIIYFAVVLYPYFNKGLASVSKDILIIITYLISYIIKLYKWLKR